MIRATVINGWMNRRASKSYNPKQVLFNLIHSNAAIVLEEFLNRGDIVREGKWVTPSLHLLEIHDIRLE